MNDILEVSPEEAPPVVVELLPESEDEFVVPAPVEPASPAVSPSESIENDSSEALPSDDENSSEEQSASDLLDSFLAGALAGAASAPTEDSSADVPAELVGIETYALSPITSATGLKGVLLDVLGPYDTVVTQYKYQQGSNQYYTYVNDIQPDYPWLASAVLFIALVLSLFSLLRRSLLWLK